jgi:spore coat protein A, manganese oxidase
MRRFETAQCLTQCRRGGRDRIGGSWLAAGRRTTRFPGGGTAGAQPPVSTDATADYYEITQQITKLRILPDLSTPAWTYNTSFPGPSIVSRSGRRTIVRHRNALPVPVVVHLHGGHTPADHDGYPVDFIMPTAGHPVVDDMARNSVVGQREYVYPMSQRAATLWYHDHRMGYTGAAVWRGLAGFHLVHDDEEDTLPLPRGKRDNHDHRSRIRRRRLLPISGH